MISETLARRIADEAFAASTADETLVLLTGGKSALTRFANNGIHQNVLQKDYSVTVLTAFGKRVGMASSNLFDRSELERIVDLASAVALAPEGGSPLDDPLGRPELRAPRGGLRPGHHRRHARVQGRSGGTPHRPGPRVGQPGLRRPHQRRLGGGRGHVPRALLLPLPDPREPDPHRRDALGRLGLVRGNLQPPRRPRPGPPRPTGPGQGRAGGESRRPRPRPPRRHPRVARRVDHAALHGHGRPGRPRLQRGTQLPLRQDRREGHGRERHPPGRLPRRRQERHALRLRGRAPEAPHPHREGRGPGRGPLATHRPRREDGEHGPCPALSEQHGSPAPEPRPSREARRARPSSSPA